MADQNSADQDWSVRMRSALAGNELAYRDLLAELSRRLRPIVRRGFGSLSAGANEIEDVVQDVLLAIHLKRHTWDQAKPIGPWIMAITRNKIIDNLRRHGRRGEVAIDGDIEQFAADDTGDAMAGHDVARVLGRLNGRNREIVQAISIDGHTTREVAERLGMSEVAVRVSLHRSLKTLAAEFQETKR